MEKEFSMISSVSFYSIQFKASKARTLSLTLAQHLESQENS